MAIYLLSPRVPKFPIGKFPRSVRAAHYSQPMTAFHACILSKMAVNDVMWNPNVGSNLTLYRCIMLRWARHSHPQIRRGVCLPLGHPRTHPCLSLLLDLNHCYSTIGRVCRHSYLWCIRVTSSLQYRRRRLWHAHYCPKAVRSRCNMWVKTDTSGLP